MKKKHQIESKYYPIIKKWLEERGYVVAIRKGIEGAGQADIVGFTLIGNKFYMEPEVVSVEVKASGKSIGRKATQAKRYTLFSNYSYAAVSLKTEDCGFTNEQIELARQLGIGLIEIRNDIKVILSPRRHLPPMANLLKIISRLGYVQCAICKSFVKRKAAYAQKRETLDKKQVIYFCKQKCNILLNLPKKAMKS